jgi:hypothetical protein
MQCLARPCKDFDLLQYECRPVNFADRETSYCMSCRHTHTHARTRALSQTDASMPRTQRRADCEHTFTAVASGGQLARGSIARITNERTVGEYQPSRLPTISMQPAVCTSLSCPQLLNDLACSQSSPSYARHGVIRLGR